MSDDDPRVEVIAGAGRRRDWPIEEKLRIVEDEAGKRSIRWIDRPPNAAVGREHLGGGAARWRGSEPSVSLAPSGDGGCAVIAPSVRATTAHAAAVQADDGVTGAAELRRMEERVRERERQLGRKTLEVEVLEEAFGKARAKNRRGSRGRR